MASPLEAGPELGQALVDDSASEELAARLAAKKLEGLELSDEEPADLKAVDAPGVGGAVTPAHPATGSTAAAGAAAERSEQPATPSKEAGAARPGKGKGKARQQPAAPADASAAEGGGAAAAAAAGDPEGVQALLDRAGFITRLSDVCYGIPQGHVKGMRAPAKFYASPKLLALVVGELETASGGFTAAVNQLCNVATLPGIVGASIGMPDIHSGYGFAIGNVAAFDVEGEGVVSPGGVGFDINCGVRVLRTNLREADIDATTRERLADALMEAIPVGVGEAGAIKLSRQDLEGVLAQGMKWTEQRGISWPEDRQVCEEHGCFKGADPGAVSERAKKRGLVQLGSLGSGNHYTELQVVDEIFDPAAAAAMGITEKGQVCVMIHTGSRGLGHQVCTDALAATDRAMARAKVRLVDRQLACMPLGSPEGRAYLGAMQAAANFAFGNRSVVTSCVRRAFAEVFGKSARELGMHMVYDVAHNIAKEEEHVVGGQRVRVLVHRKGATRAFPPGHPLVPEKYREVGQPVLIGGSMGTASYILTGTQTAMEASETFGSTCHGAGRAMSRSHAVKTLDSKEVLRLLQRRGIAVRVATRHLAAEEAPESYKDVDAVVDTCHAAGISRKAVRLRPIAVIKG